MDGVLAVWKPAGWTSHDVVAKVRRIIRVKRIGHAGTLDPQVTGVLPLCIGRATRVVEYLQELPKAYEAVLQLGIATDTEDLTGQVVARVPEVRIGRGEIEAALASFRGEIEQIPPMYSAVKVEGKRLYELAREGKSVDRKPRKVTIYDLKLGESDLERPDPRITFTVVCSKGTYIRTLCVDIGRALGVPAAMAQLTRTMSAGLTAEHCLTIEQIEELAAAGTLADRLIPADAAVGHLRRISVGDETAAMASQGRAVPYGRLSENPDDGETVRLYAAGGAFIGLFKGEEAARLLRPVKVFAPGFPNESESM
ncbi:tRNA pseudouridine synthase B [Paenibacillus sp. 32O-W]|uniref:tRNA pseudouridine(55) synthase TruB n=1 Tax=Paenibacillus sp. 32O-W TaxID=1695218 RepID=UPI00071EE8B1|nr:tRNA pseudouridine(55) synthase TruB [Paenibacillus sp. 32O-W]ALS27596.1 tRNA pseudouridine synthase B [Paenibacillus sp. 32O-W]